MVLDGGSLTITSEWAKRQGTHKVTGADAVPQKLSDSNLELVRGVGQGSNFVYAVIGDQRIERISLEGVTQIFVDCTDSVDDVRFYRFSK